MDHDLKILPEYYQAVIEGRKQFEIRFNDRNFKVGDHFTLREYTNTEGYTGRKVNGVITYILDYEQNDGYVVFGFELLSGEYESKYIRTFAASVKALNCLESTIEKLHGREYKNFI